MYDICTTILAINPSAQVSCIEEDIDRITWHAGTAVISKSDIQAKQAELKSQYENNKYQLDRKEAYPSIEEQLDDLYHNGISGWKTTIKATKDKYPKP